jgi:hypothetical protein
MPLVLAVFGYLIQQKLSEQDRAWKTSQRVIDRRLQVYDSIGRDLNRIYCFVQDVGTWKEDTPEKVIGYKRSIDGQMHAHRAIWPRDTFAAYVDYMDRSAFLIFQGVGSDPRIRTGDGQKRIGVVGWKSDWSAQLTGERDPNHRQKYERLVDLISRDLSFRGD